MVKRHPSKIFTSMTIYTSGNCLAHKCTNAAISCLDICILKMLERGLFCAGVSLSWSAKHPTWSVETCYYLLLICLPYKAQCFHCSFIRHCLMFVDFIGALYDLQQNHTLLLFWSVYDLALSLFIGSILYEKRRGYLCACRCVHKTFSLKRQQNNGFYNYSLKI
jgi:hypothetical protein